MSTASVCNGSALVVDMAGLALSTEVAPEGDRAHLMREAFGRYLRPNVMAKLRAIRLDVVYHRAEGSRLWGTTGTGRSIEVVDLIGGYGAALFGHNHPALVAVARQMLDQRRPFNAQASVRGPAGLLGQALSDRLSRITGEPGYVTTLAGSGAEVVEAAIKHAELERHAQGEERLRALGDVVARARRAARKGRLTWDATLHQQVAGWLGVPVAEDLEALLDAVTAAAHDSLSRPGTVFAIAGAFHGKTTGALRLTHNPVFRAPWRHLGETVFLPLDDVDAAEAAVAAARRPFVTLSLDAGGRLRAHELSLSTVTACFVEPIQGEAGVRPLSREFLQALRRLATLEGFPLVLDEIQCGMGRTGDFLASEASGIAGDYYLLAKSLGGGIAKIAALVVAASRYQASFGFLHTSTFADDDWSANVALAALELLEHDDQRIARECREKGAYLRERLQALVDRYPGALVEVRSRGLMLGLELRDQDRAASPLLRALSEQNLLGYFAAGHLLEEEGFRVAPSLSAASTIRIEPAFCVEYAELDRFCGAVERFAAALEQADVARLFGFAFGSSAAPRRRRGPAAGVSAAVASNAPARVVGPAARKVGFLVHLMAPEDLRHLDAGLRRFGPAACADFLERTRGLLEPMALPPTRVRSGDGSEVDLQVIAVPFTCDQAVASLRAGELGWMAALVNQGVALARQRGCHVLGFGGYTSIVTDNCRAVSDDRLALTSGNSLTVAAGVAALWDALEVGGDRDAPIIGVVGATGNIGAMLAELASERAQQIVLFGRPGSASRLERVRARLQCDSRIETDLDALAGCTGVLSATNAPSPIITPTHFEGRPRLTRVICDLAVPRDVAPAVGELPGLRLIRGGLLRLPGGQELGIGGLTPARGCVYACLAESLLMGFGGRDEHLSYGALDRDGVRLAWQLAQTHGFEVEQKPATPAWR